MHGCLRLTEILEAIFYFVFNSRPLDSISNITFIFRYSGLPPLISHSPREDQDRRSVLRLALTCRAFRDLALDVLYSQLTDSLPLFWCLPPELRHSHRPGSPVHNTPEHFLPQLVLRAARVRIFVDSGSFGNQYAFYLASASPNDTPLFPKLRSLTWCDSDLTSIPTLRLFLPTLEALSFKFYIDNEPFFKAVIPGLRIAAPRLKALEFRGMSPTSDSISEIESLLLSYPEGLTALSLPSCDISSSLLHHIAPWPRLQWLTMKLGSNSIPTVPLHAYASQPFLALTHLHILCEDLGRFVSFLRAFQIIRMDSDTRSFGYPNLKTIHVTARNCSPGTIWSQLLSILTRTNLEHLILTESCHHQACPNASSSFDLHPLLVDPTALADLKTLVISPVKSSSIALTDSDILILARTCPCLEILRVCNTPVSLHALRILASRCRELCEVSLCLDARLDALGAPPPDNDQVALKPNMRLVKLLIGPSPIACVGPLDPPTAPDLMRSIPRFLNAMAPRLSTFFRMPGEEEPRKIYQERWYAVLTTLSAMAKGEVEGSD